MLRVPMISFFIFSQSLSSHMLLCIEPCVIVSVLLSVALTFLG